MAKSRRLPGPPPKLLNRGVSAYLVNLYDWLYKLWLSWADGIPPGFGNLTPTPVGPGVAGSAGVETDGWAPALHRHPFLTAAPSVPISLGTTAAEGSATTGLRSDLRFDTVGLLAEILALINNTVLAPPQITANQNNYAPGVADVYYLDSNADWNITGLTAGTNGEVRYLINVGLFNISLTDADAASTSGNRFVTPGNVPLVMNPGDMSMLVYDLPRAYWRAYESVGGAVTVGADPGWVEFWGPPYYSQAPG